MPEKKHPFDSPVSTKGGGKDFGKEIHPEGEQVVSPVSTEDDIAQEQERGAEKSITHSLVRLRKTIIFHEHKTAAIDTSVVRPEFYNAFDCSSLPEIMTQEKFVLGVTSPGVGDGKTLAAANLAVSIAMSQRKETVLVDFNIGRGRLHKVFDIPLAPGFLDALNDTVIHVSRTNVRHLSVMSAGNPLTKSFEAASLTMGIRAEEKSAISLEQLSDFRNLVYSLEKEFDMVIVDLPSIQDSGIPSLFAKQLDGIVVVVNAGTTKKGNLDQVLFHLNASNVVGFIFNRAAKENFII